MRREQDEPRETIGGSPTSGIAGVAELQQQLELKKAKARALETELAQVRTTISALESQLERAETQSASASASGRLETDLAPTLPSVAAAGAPTRSPAALTSSSSTPFAVAPMSSAPPIIPPTRNRVVVARTMNAASRAAADLLATEASAARRERTTGVPERTTRYAGVPGDTAAAIAAAGEARYATGLRQRGMSAPATPPPIIPTTLSRMEVARTMNAASRAAADLVATEASAARGESTIGMPEHTIRYAGVPGDTAAAIAAAGEARYATGYLQQRGMSARATPSKRTDYTMRALEQAVDKRATSRANPSSASARQTAASALGRASASAASHTAMLAQAASSYAVPSTGSTATHPMTPKRGRDRQITDVRSPREENPGNRSKVERREARDASGSTAPRGGRTRGDRRSGAAGSREVAHTVMRPAVPRQSGRSPSVRGVWTADQADRLAINPEVARTPVSHSPPPALGGIGSALGRGVGGRGGGVAPGGGGRGSGGGGGGGSVADR